MIQGQAGGEDVVLARRGGEFFAVGAYCSHYPGPLAKGLMVGDELRCPLHHACFNSDVTVVVLEHSGHWVLEERPKETTDALMKFL